MEIKNRKIRKVLFKSTVPFEIEVHRLENILDKYYSFITAPHRTNFYHLFIIEGGNPTHFVDFNPATLKANQVFTINKDCVHYFDPKIKTIV